MLFGQIFYQNLNIKIEKKKKFSLVLINWYLREDKLYGGLTRVKLKSSFYFMFYLYI